MAGIYPRGRERPANRRLARADLAPVSAPAASARRNADLIRRIVSRQFFLPSRFVGRGERRVQVPATWEWGDSFCDRDPGDLDGAGTDWLGQANRDRRVFDRLWRLDARSGTRVWPRRPGSGAADPGEIPGREKERAGRRTITAVSLAAWGLVLRV